VLPQVGTFIAGLSPFAIWLLPSYAGVLLFIVLLSVGHTRAAAPLPSPRARLCGE
jgi:hypothetical protein